MNAIPYGRGEVRGDRATTTAKCKTVTLAHYLDTMDSIRLYRAQRVLNEQARTAETAAEPQTEPESEDVLTLTELLPPLAPAVRAEGAYLVRTVDHPLQPTEAPVETPAQTMPEAFARVRRRSAVLARLPSSSWLAGIAAVLLAAGITAGTLGGLDSEPPAELPVIAPPAPPPAVPDIPAPVAAVAPTPPRPEVVYGHASVVDSATVIVDGKELHLSGLRGETGHHAERLRLLIAAHGGVLACHARNAGYHCLLPGRLDIAAWALRTGTARPAGAGSAEP